MRRRELRAWTLRVWVSQLTPGQDVCIVSDKSEEAMAASVQSLGDLESASVYNV